MAAPTYRQWLQDRSVNGSSDAIRNQASALLQVVGDDFGIDKRFIADPYGFAATRPGGSPLKDSTQGQILGYGPTGMTQINNQMRAAYESPNRQFGASSGNDENTYNPYGTGGGGSGSSVNPQTISQLDQSASMIKKALDRLDNQFGIAKGNITKQYEQYENELKSQRAANENSYKTSTTQNQQGFRTNKNTINDQASQGLRGLQRLLGSYGAVGSDMGLAGRAVSDVASAQNAGAGQNYSQNQQTLDTNWGNYRNQWENERKKAIDWRDQQINQAEAQSKTNRQDLLGQLADIQGRLSQARGGQYTDGAQSYLDKANSLSSKIDALGKINPRYDGRTPVYDAPELSTYKTDNPAVAQLQERATGGLNTPFLNMLLGRDDREKQLMY